MASAVVELNHQMSDSSLASKPTRSHAQILDSIPLDNPSGTDPKTNEATIRCNHFSIRGYVSELRKRDPKLCDPFSPYRTHDDSIEPRNDLPPMVVPKFRWWNCAGCVPTSDIPTPIGKEAQKSATDKSAHPSQSILKETNLEAPRDRNAEAASTSSESNKNQNCSRSSIGIADRKGKGKAHVEDELIEAQTGNEIVESHQKNSMSDMIETGALKDYTSHEDGKAQLLSLPDLNECNKAPSDDAVQTEVLVFGNDILCEEEDDYLGVDHRKVPKVRLLSDLLGLKENHSDAKLNRRNKRLRLAHSEVSESESEDDSSDIISEALVKKHSKSILDKKPLLEKRNNLKKIKIDHGNFSLVSQLKITPKLSYEKGKSSETNHASTNASTVKPCPGVCSESDLVTDLPREGDVSANLNEKRLGNDQIHVTPGKDGFDLLPSSTGPIIIDYSVGKKHTSNTIVRETSLEFRTSGSAPVTESRVNGTKDRGIGPKTNSKPKQALIPEEEDRSPSVQHNAVQVASSVMNRKGLTRSIKDIDINSIPTDEQGAGDDGHDIPMDIVELMAKNQYERNLSYTKDKHLSVSPSENVRSNGSTSTQGKLVLKSQQPHFLSWQNPLPKDAKNSVTSGFEATDSSKQNFNRTKTSFGNHLTKNQVSARSITFSQGQEPYSAPGLTPNHWTGHMVAQQRCIPGFLQTMGSYNTCHTSTPQPNTEAHVWSSVLGGNKGKSHHQGPNILSFGSVNLEKQNINFSNTYNGGKQKRASYPLKPGGSADLYSNEVIPAMHLLSLMQNAAKMRSGVGTSTDAGKQEPPKRAPILPNNQESRHPLFENNGRASTIHGISRHPCYPTLPTVHSFASLFQNDGGIGRKTSFLTPIPLTSHGQRNIESSHFASVRPPKPISCNVGRKRQLDSALDKGKGVSGKSNPSSSADPFQGTKDSANYPYGLAKTCASQKEICMLNQNPSEFNDLKELRKYMIRPEDLRPRETRNEKSAHRGNAKRQEMRMNKHIPCLVG